MNHPASTATLFGCPAIGSVACSLTMMATALMLLRAIGEKTGEKTGEMTEGARGRKGKGIHGDG